MTGIFSKFFTVSLICALSFTSAYSQVNVLVKITDQNGAVLLGGSQMVGFVQQTEIESFGQESSRCAAFGNSCNPVTGNFIYNFIPDNTLTDYRIALYTNRIWRKVEISFVRFTGGGGGQTTVYEKITLEDVSVVALTENGGSGSINTFQTKLDPAKVTWTFITELPNGNPGTPRTFGYNRITNQPF